METGNIDIQITPDVSEGTYSNMAILSHSPSEFILDFAQMLPGLKQNEAVVRQRIIMAPMHTKRLLAALQDNIQKYEEKYGPIAEPMMKPNDPRRGNFDVKGNA